MWLERKSLTPWLTIISGNNGTTSGTIRYAVEANPGSANRVGFIKVANQLIAITQAGNGTTCNKFTETVATGERVYYSRELTVNDCTSVFNAEIKADRYKINGKAGQQLQIEVFANDFEPRVSLFTSAGKLLATDYRRLGFGGYIVLPIDGAYTIEVSGTQPEDLGIYNLWFYKGCECKFLTRKTDFDGTGGAGEMAFSLPPDCTWKSTAASDWITVPQPAAGSGSGVIKFTVKSESLINQQREGIIWLYLDPNRTSNYFQYKIKQIFPCEFTITPSTLRVGNMGGDGRLSLFGGQFCAPPEIKSDSSWLQVGTSIYGGGYFDAAIKYANPGTAPRKAKITVGNAGYEVIQPGIGSACNIVNIALGETAKGTLNRNCALPSPTNDLYLERFHGSYYAFQGVTGQRIGINYSGAEMGKDLYLIAPDGLNITPDLSTYSNDTLRIPKQSTTFLLPQTGRYVIALGGYEEQESRTNFTLTLDEMKGTDCSLALRESILQPTGKGGNVVATVVQSAGTSCEWQAQSNVSWVTIEAGANGVGNGATTFSLAPNLNGLRYAYIPIASQHLKILQEQAQPLGIVSGASYTKVFARGAIASIFGTNLTMSTEQAAALPLPTTLGGVNVVLYRKGIYSFFPLECVLFYASPTQINFLLPEYSVEAEEEFTVYVKRTDGYTSIGELRFSPVAPALFSATSDGQGVASAVVQRVKGEVQTYEQVAELSGGKVVPRAINLGGGDEQVYLVLFGTGIRYRTNVSNVSANIGGTAFPVEYAGNQYYFSGVDQINILLPKSLRGKGVVPVSIIVDGKVSNTTEIKIAP